MKRFFRHTALALVVSASCGGVQAAIHSESFGVYSTAVQEDRLFIENGTILRCDLFFTSAKDQSQVVAPKGSRVSQSLPPFVWQYSGLLPVSDYLKTAAVHSFSSEVKERSWQDVQATFYEGLRSEGARDFEAKVAFAGAYAFAPRWPLVDFIDITIEERDKGTRLYRVEYIPATAKSVSIDEYRTLVEDIVKNSEQVSLQDIRGIIDAADAAKAGAAADDAGWLKKIWRNGSPATGAKDLQLEDELKTAKVSVGNDLGALFASEKTSSEELPPIVIPKKLIPSEELTTEKEVAAEQVTESAEQPNEAGKTIDPLGEVVPIPELESMESANVLTLSESETPMPAADVAMPEPVAETVVPEVEIREVQLVPEIVVDPNSVSDQLSVADRLVLQPEAAALPVPVGNKIEAQGEVVDLTLIDQQALPALGNGEGEDNEPVPPSEIKRWRVLPDGSQVLEVILEQ